MKKDIELSNVSYTNKDFFDIYPELLSLAKRLSSKWDPTVSNESDPGVVLIKELALIGDKINYISDKYALENNPRSVTQLENARQLYNLLGYYPRWFESSKVNLSLYWKGDKEENNYVTIPKFTGVQDADGEFVYTTLHDILLPLNGNFATGDVEAIEGTYNRLVVNNSDVITLSMLSDDQRIYINNYNVALNGLFVTDTTGSIEWERVDNINLLAEHSRCYSFNVDIVTGECYLQFPRDIAYLIGDGLIVGYILSKGENGNIPINHLDRIVSSEIITSDSSGESRTIETENIAITNSGATYRGKDPETIDEMYENWKHVASTFNTLVTLRDYNNCLRRYPDIASNGFITDRTNDIQDSYKIMQGTSDQPNTKIKVERSSEEKPILTAYDLKLYGLRSFPYANIDTYNDYDSTFKLFPEVDFDIVDSSTMKMLDAIDTYQCISHDFTKLEPLKMCLLKNKYNINLQILTNQELTDLQVRDLKLNICRAIYSNFNSAKIEFGEKIDYDDLVSCIKNSDNRIKTAILDRLTYDTYAVFYLDNGQINWFEVPVSDGAYEDFVANPENYISQPWARNFCIGKAGEFRKEIVAKNILAGITPYLVDSGGGYPYYLDSNSTLHQEADHVKTNLYIPLEFTSTTQTINIQLEPNEVIQISKPNLLDVRTYGAYIYYEFKGTKSVEANFDYILGSDESICFFYKEADKDSRYRFDLYGAGTIIQPTFELVPNDSNDITTKIFGSKRPTDKGECLTTYQPLQSTRAYDGLSVSDSITIRKVNQITLGDPESYIFFITNKVENSKYVLEFIDGRRVLNEGEYFIYTNSSKTSLEILGSGTEIRWIGESSPYSLTCDYVQISEIALQGSTALRDKWVTIKKPVVLQVVEKSFTNALAGDTVTITLNGEYDQNTMVLDSSGLASASDVFSWSPDPAPTNPDMVIAAVPNTDFGGTEQNTIKNFLRYMYREDFFTTIKNETMSIQCFNLREGAEDQDFSMYAWKCEDPKTGNATWILDQESWNLMFEGSEHLFDSPEDYYDIVSGGSVISGAAVGRLTTIDNIARNDSGGSSGGSTSDTVVGEDIDYHPTAIEKQAAEAWFTLYSSSGEKVKYLQQFITYFSTSTYTAEDAVNDIIYITYNYTAESDRIVSLSGFTVKINDGENLAVATDDSLAPEIHAYLNLDLGPDNPQTIRYDEETGIKDQIYFYLNGTLKGSLNGDEDEPADHLLYASGNIFAEGSSDLIDVRLLDDHLNYYNPIFYAYKNVESLMLDDQSLFTEKGSTSYINFGKATSSDQMEGGTMQVFSDSINLPEGDFMMSVAHSNTCLSKLKLYFGNQQLTKLGDSSNADISEPGTYYLTFHSEGSDSNFYVEYALKNTANYTKQQIEELAGDYEYGDIFRSSEQFDIFDDNTGTTITVNVGDYVICRRSRLDSFNWSDWAKTEYPLDSLVLSPLMMYEINDSLTVNTEDVYSLIESLDYDKEFNYLYKIPEKKMIKNPLKSESFLNKNHVYNQFTICECKLPEILA